METFAHQLREIAAPAKEKKDAKLRKESLHFYEKDFVPAARKAAEEGQYFLHIKNIEYDIFEHFKSICEKEELSVFDFDEYTEVSWENDNKV
jgi:4-amino-4-deoxy-L-arabinose transferase-like glycosyltransferase